VIGTVVAALAAKALVYNFIGNVDVDSSFCGWSSAIRSPSFLGSDRLRLNNRKMVIVLCEMARLDLDAGNSRDGIVALHSAPTIPPPRARGTPSCSCLHVFAGREPGLRMRAPVVVQRPWFMWGRSVTALPPAHVLVLARSSLLSRFRHSYASWPRPPS